MATVGGKGSKRISPLVEISIFSCARCCRQNISVENGRDKNGKGEDLRAGKKEDGERVERGRREGIDKYTFAPPAPFEKTLPRRCRTILG